MVHVSRDFRRTPTASRRDSNIPCLEKSHGDNGHTTRQYLHDKRARFPVFFETGYTPHTLRSHDTGRSTSRKARRGIRSHVRTSVGSSRNSLKSIMRKTPASAYMYRMPSFPNVCVTAMYASLSVSCEGMHKTQAAWLESNRDRRSSLVTPQSSATRGLHLPNRGSIACRRLKSPRVSRPRFQVLRCSSTFSSLSRAFIAPGHLTSAFARSQRYRRPSKLFRARGNTLHAKHPPARHKPTRKSLGTRPAAG